MHDQLHKMKGLCSKMRQGLEFEINCVNESFERTKELFTPDAKGRQLVYMLNVNAESG
jgi:hypothetical protein